MNEALLIVSAIADFQFVMFARYFGRSWLYAAIIVNLLLISIVGQKIVEIWGFATNVGNVFYASVFLGMYLLLQHEPKKYAFHALWLGVVTVVSFTVLMLFTLGMQSIEHTAPMSDAMSHLFQNAPRLALASLMGFVLAQLLNISLYEPIEDGGKQWLRFFAIMMVAQLVDSVVFFTVAFWGVVPASIVMESLVVGYIIKVVLGAISVPLVIHCVRPRESAQPLVA